MLTQAIASLAADPTALPLWGTLLMAVAMYPLGMIFGCSPCCQPAEPCSACENGELPETITVTLDGFTDESPSDPLYRVEFAACFGFGAAAHPSAPGGRYPDDAGPISGITVTDKGSGYAVFGREQPTVSVSIDGSPTESASATVSLSQKADDCGRAYWEVSGVTIDSGGNGYEDGAAVSFSVAEGDTIDQYAYGTIATTRAAPSLTMNVVDGTGIPSSGYGAEISHTVEEIAGSNPRLWQIASVTVANGGANYRHGDMIAALLNSDFDKQETPPNITITVDAGEPTVSAAVQSSTGSGATLTATIENTTNDYGQSVWGVVSISIDQPGAGYSVYDLISVTTSNGVEQVGAFAFVSEVGEDGEILAIEIAGGGEYYVPGPILSATIHYGGEFWRNGGAVASVNVTNKGRFYRENPALPPYVATVTATVVDDGASAHGPIGTGAQLSAVVDSDTGSETFGQITSVTVSNGGSGYLAWIYLANDCCGHYLNGQSVTLTRFQQSNTPQCYNYWTHVAFTIDGETVSVAPSCVYTHRFCGGWQSPFGSVSPYGITSTQSVSSVSLYVGFVGEGQRAVAMLGRPCGGVSSDGAYFQCAAGWRSPEPIESCSELEWSATNETGQSISVAPGGSYDAGWRCAGCGNETANGFNSCGACCQGSEATIPAEIEMTIEWDADWEPAMDYADRSAPFEIGNPYAWWKDQSAGATYFGSGTMPKSGTYVLNRWGANLWYLTFERFVNHPSLYGTQHTLWARIDTCGECGDCIKKCTIRTWSPFGLDYQCETGCDKGKSSGKLCNAETPICSIPSGFSLTYSCPGNRQNPEPMIAGYDGYEPFNQSQYVYFSWLAAQYKQTLSADVCNYQNGFLTWVENQIPFSGGNSVVEFVRGDYGYISTPQNSVFPNFWKFFQSNPTAPDDYVPLTNYQKQNSWNVQRDQWLRGYYDINWKNIVTVRIE